MKQSLIIAAIFSLFLGASISSEAQLKPRPDAFPPEADEFAPKALQMASSVEQMAGWDRYPTYETYLAMMQQWVDSFPNLCHIDTIGTSIRGRLILSMYIEPTTDDDLYIKNGSFYEPNY